MQDTVSATGKESIVRIAGSREYLCKMDRELDEDLHSVRAEFSMHSSKKELPK